jgi:hypothetical protein
VFSRISWPSIQHVPRPQSFTSSFYVCDDSLILLTTFPPFSLSLTAHSRCYKRLYKTYETVVSYNTDPTSHTRFFLTIGLSQKCNKLILDTKRQVQNVDAFNFLSFVSLLSNLPVFIPFLTNFGLRFHS